MDEEMQVKIDEVFKDYVGGIEQLKQICPCGQHLLVTISIPLDLLQKHEIDVTLKPLD